ncbi:hypothetical protein D3C80_675430 [compost metagenome]
MLPYCSRAPHRVAQAFVMHTRGHSEPGLPLPFADQRRGAWAVGDGQSAQLALQISCRHLPIYRTQDFKQVAVLALRFALAIEEFIAALLLLQYPHRLDDLALAPLGDQFAGRPHIDPFNVSSARPVRQVLD